MPYYQSVNGLTGQALQVGLREIISTERTRSYDDARDILQISDRDPSNYNNVILVYKRTSVLGLWDGGNTWNREHVWPQSLLSGASKSDLHNLKPADPNVNSSRGNNAFAEGSGSYKLVPGGFYPGDEAKGDIARIIFFMITRYSQLNINTMGSLPMFMRWHEEDPVDAKEIHRNEILFQEQENRNPFIDHPEFVSLIWGSAQASYTVASDNEIITNVNYVEVLISYYKTQSKYVKREEPHLFYS
jgi:endonuclease I